MGRLQSFIPINLQEQILKIADEDTKTIVYRVDKSGEGSTDFVKSTFEEMQEKSFTRKYSLCDISSYSTSVYDNAETCFNFINSMGRKARERFPKPIVRKGSLKRGLSKYTYEYKEGYNDKGHIDYWIYDGFKENVIKDFNEFNTCEGK